MELSKQIEQIEHLQRWACDKVMRCHNCEYSIDNSGDGSVCSFEVVIDAIKDRAKERDNNDR